MTAKHFRTIGLFLLILGIAILGIGGYLVILPQQYKATAFIRIDIPPKVEPSNEAEENSDDIRSNFEGIQSEEVLDNVIRYQDLNQRWGKRLPGQDTFKTADTRELLRQQLSIAPGPKTNELFLSVTSHDPVEAAKLANAIVDQFGIYKGEDYLRKRKNRAIAETDEKIEALSNNGDSSITNSNKIESMKKFRDVLALRTSCTPIPIVETIRYATPPASPPIRLIGKTLITFGILFEVSGLILLNRSRQRKAPGMG